MATLSINQVQTRLAIKKGLLGVMGHKYKVGAHSIALDEDGHYCGEFHVLLTIFLPPKLCPGKGTSKS